MEKWAYNHIFFYIKHRWIYRWNRCLPALHVLSTRHAVWWNLQRENWVKPAFKLCDVLECPNESCFHSYRNVFQYTEKWNRQSKYIYYINKRFFFKLCLPQLALGWKCGRQCKTGLIYKDNKSKGCYWEWKQGHFVW